MRLEESAARLTAAGVRPTANRILVLHALAVAQGPLSLAELERRLLPMDKSSIFRALTVLRGAHLLHAFSDGDGAQRYEVCHCADAEHDTDHHVHFFCQQCRRTFCMESVPLPEVELPEGWRASSASYMVSGVCPECAGKRR